MDMACVAVTVCWRRADGGIASGRPEAIHSLQEHVDVI